MTEEENKIYALSFPLQIQKWQADILNKRFSVLSLIYDSFQKKMKRKYYYASQSKKFKEAEKSGKKYWKSTFFKKEYKETYVRKIGAKKGEKDQYFPFTEFGFGQYILKFGPSFSNCGINSKILQSIASYAWKAWDKFLSGDGNTIRYHGTDEINTYKIGICNKKFIGIDDSMILSKNIIGINVNGRHGKNAKIIYMPFKVNKKSLYETFCFQDEIREIGFKRKLIRGKYKYYVLFTFKGHPYTKGRKLGNGCVGIDLGPSEAAIASNTKVMVQKLPDGNKENDTLRIQELQRKMDSSRRANNPVIYDENGVSLPKKQWPEGYKIVNSKNYLRLKGKLNDIQRKIRERRRIEQFIIANEVASLGNVFKVEKNPVSAWAKRAKEQKYDKNGRCMSKKRYGTSIGKHSPSEFINILENKVNFLGGELKKIDIKNACTQYDFTNNTFVKHEIKEREIQLSNGDIHNRDLISAFNIMHCLGTEKKNIKTFDTENMKRNYETFYKLEKESILR